MVHIKRKVFAITLIAAIILVALAVGLYFGLKSNQTTVSLGKGAVVANGVECASIGRNILQKGGSAVDAAIATLFCEGVTCPQSMGLSGGFLATIYTKATKTVETLIARETAPLKATEDMFVNNTVTGGLAVAVPGEIKGYSELHKKYGKLAWSTLIQPTIELCRNGHIVTSYLARILKLREDAIKNVTSLREIFINPKTSETWNEGDIIKRPKLAETLEILAKEGVDSIYNGGTIGKLLIKDIQEFGGIITEQDLKEYRVEWRKPLVAHIKGDHRIYTIPLPGSGIVLNFIINLINNYLPNDDTLRWHRIIESFKHAYGMRTHLGDDRFVTGIEHIISNLTNSDYATQHIRTLIKDDRTFTDYKYYGAKFANVEDHGTVNMAVLAPNGDAITVTSTINNILGSLRRSQSTGIILNDEMDDFSTPGKNNGNNIPPSPANFIKPKKRPLSSMCPSIILDKNDNVRLLIGAAGGSKITSAVALAIIRHLMLNETLENAVQAKRLHHQLAPMEIQYEIGFDQIILNGLAKIGHKLVEIPLTSGFAAMTGISSLNGDVVAVTDNRRNGSTAIME